VLVPGEGWHLAQGVEAAVNFEGKGGQWKARGSPGRKYVTDRTLGTLTLIEQQGKSRPRRLLLDSTLKQPMTVAVSLDGLWLAVAESGDHVGYSYRIEADGRVSGKRRFYSLQVPEEANDSGIVGWVMDREGRLYAATHLGVQILDRNGRVRAILPVPGGAAAGIAFGGADFKTLYIKGAYGDVHSRRLTIPGLAPGTIPMSLPDGNAG
jgi:gluconolactonase